MHLVDISALYAAIGEGHVSAQSVVQKLVAQFGGSAGLRAAVTQRDAASAGIAHNEVTK
jgi:GTP pyrophosphokinase